MEQVVMTFLIFIFYSFLGWCIESFGSIAYKGHFINRGFLIGPICPVYGFGFLLIYYLLRGYLSAPIILFCMSVIICSSLEYFTSWIMEKLFNARWWDYSNRRFNINGRICLDNSALFGVLSFIIMYNIHPSYLGLLNAMNYKTLLVIAIIIFILFVADVLVSVNVISRLKTVAHDVKVKDNTEEMKAKVRESFAKQGKLYNRLAKAFDFVVNNEVIAELRVKVKSGASKAKNGITKRISSASIELEKKAKKNIEYRVKLKELKLQYREQKRELKRKIKETE